MVVSRNVINNASENDLVERLYEMVNGMRSNPLFFLQEENFLELDDLIDKRGKN